MVFRGFISRGLSVSTLCLSNCALTSFGAQMLSIILEETNITEVHYSDNDISYEGAVAIANALTNSRVLRELILQNASLSDNSIKLIAKAATQCPSLVKLDLSRNTIGPVGANWITPSIKEFYVDRLTVTSAGIDKMGTSTYRTLQEDSLANVITNNNNAASLAESLTTDIKNLSFKEDDIISQEGYDLI